MSITNNLTSSKLINVYLLLKTAMRNLIIGCSVFFYFLSGIITLKALGLPANGIQGQHIKKKISSEEILPQLENILENFAKEQSANRMLVEKLQITISSLEEKLSIKGEEVKAKDERKESSMTTVLAVLGAGTFRSGQTIITEDMVDIVKGLVSDIEAHPDSRVVIEGHTDSIPIKFSPLNRYRDNMELSFLRAKAVAMILEEQGIPLGRISVIGYSDTRPIASNETFEGRVKNRRVEVKLVPGNREF